MALLVPLTLFTVMLALGVGLPLQAFRQWRQTWPLVMRLELATCLLVPLVAWLLLLIPPAGQLSQEVRMAIALMAACPSAPLILRKAGKTGGDASLAGLLQVGAALLAIITVPLLAQAAEPVFGVAGWDVLPRQVARQVATVQLLPLLVGLWLRRSWPEHIRRLQGMLDRLANGLLLVLFGAILIRIAPLLLAFAQANGIGLLWMALVVLASLGLGYGLGGSAGDRKLTAALVTSMRNPGLALLLANTYAPQVPGLKIGILTYLLITVLLSIPLIRRRRFELGASFGKRRRFRSQLPPGFSGRAPFRAPH
ncbi:MAG: bile acid:sodium symporter [Cyanobium sp. M30B3]|nr:MAG: bile acid:sodium symporter [Cyanobium sp. M30B3]